MGEDFGAFVDWSLMGDVSRDAAPGKTEYADAKECKRHARSGQWAKSHSQRAQVYRRLIHALPCRSVTPDASVYRSNQPKRASTTDTKLKNGDVWTVALPEFASGAPVPRYCLKHESAGSVASVLERLASEFPDVSYCPLLPAVTALLLHWSSDEALCFEAAARLLATTKQRMLHQTFLAHRASCMTFGDLARKHCPAAHEHVVSLARESKEDVAEVYGDWQHWVFGDLPFSHAARVMDVFLVEGFKVLYRVALALLKLYRKQRADRRKGSGGVGADLREFVRGVASGVSPDKLMEKAFAIRLFSRKEISLLQLANERALQQKGITLQQKRCDVYD